MLLLSKLFMSLGVLFAVIFLLAFTSIPLKVKFWLAETGGPIGDEPAYIVVMGSGDLPNPEKFMRIYYAAEVAHRYPAAEMVASLPTSGDPNRAGVGVVRDELVMRGVERERIRLLFWAHSTHEEAVQVREMLGPDALSQAILVVTSPEHVLRTVLSFRKAGFQNVSAVAAKAAGGLCCLKDLRLVRYRFWQGLHDQVSVMRELTALVYYKIRGWI